MDSGLITVLLPLALAIIMAGLGLELTVADFARVGRHPRAVVVALFCQLVLLVGVAFLLCHLLSLPPMLAVGLMLLAASPGGSTANLFSYLYRGDVALNITLTAINSVIAALTLPLILNLSMAYFLSQEQQLGLQFGKALQVFAIILIPVGLGMLMRRWRPDLAARASRPMRLFAVLFLVGIIVMAVFRERHNVMDYLAQIGLAAALFCALSLTVGYLVPRLFGIGQAQARACAFEIGVHNSTLAMTLALTVLASTTLSIPAAVYSLFMYPFAALFGMALNRWHPLPAAATDARPGPRAR